MKILLSEHIIQLMSDEAIRCYPEECCGFMYGTDEGGVRKLKKATTVNNDAVENREKRFRISPQDYMNAEKKALELDMQLLGVYHSHPDHPAIASEHDRKSAMPFFSYVIISVQQGKIMDIRSWRLNDGGQFEEEDISKSIHA